MTDIKKLFFDVETTGVDHRRNTIHQLSGILEINDDVVEEFNLKTRPHPKAVITQDALDACGVDELTIMSYPEHRMAHKEFLGILTKYVDRFNKFDKLIIVGYNCQKFDDPFLRVWFELCGDKFYGSWFWPNTLDVMALATEYLLRRRAFMPNFQLGGVAKELGIKVDKDRLHDAIYDVYLTREIYRIITNRDLL